MLGITTGLSCGTQIAHVFLICLDIHVQSALRGSFWLYKRYVDDVFIFDAQHVTTVDIVPSESSPPSPPAAQKATKDDEMHEAKTELVAIHIVDWMNLSSEVDSQKYFYSQPVLKDQRNSRMFTASVAAPLTLLDLGDVIEKECVDCHDASATTFLSS